MVSQTTDRFNGYVASLAVKVPCVVAATTNITLSGAQTIATIAVVTGDRVLVIGQTDPIENGIYLVTSSEWDRAPDFDGRRDATTNSLVLAAVAGGDPVLYKIDTATPFIIGEDAVNFSAYLDPAGGGVPHTHLLAAGATDVTASASEVNLLDLGGLTAGWVLSADTASTASWKAPAGGGADFNTPVDIIGDINLTTGVRGVVAGAFTAELRFVDNDETDVAAVMGFQAAEPGDLIFQNITESSDIIFKIDDWNGGSTPFEILRMHKGNSAAPGEEGYIMSNRGIFNYTGTIGASRADPPLMVTSGAGENGQTVSFLGLWNGAIQHFNAAGGGADGAALSINTWGGAVNIGPITQGTGGVNMGHGATTRARTRSYGFEVASASSTAPSSGTVGADTSIQIGIRTSFSPILRLGIRTSDDSAYLSHDIHGQAWYILAQNSGGSNRNLIRASPVDGVALYIPDLNTQAARTATVANGLFEVNIDGLGDWRRVLYEGELGGGSNTNWSTGGGSTYGTGSTSGFESGAVATFEAGSVLEIEETATMANPAAGFGRFWVRDDVPNVPVYTNDAGDIIVLGTQAIVTATTTELEDIADAINTGADKVAGYMVFNTTDGAPVWAVGAADGSVWNDATGTLAHTPVV